MAETTVSVSRNNVLAAALEARPSDQLTTVSSLKTRVEGNVYVSLRVVSDMRMSAPMFCSARCAVPGYPEDTWQLKGPEHAQLVNVSIPLDPAVDGKGGYSRCHVYVRDNVTMETTSEKCSRFVYDPASYASSAVTEVGFFVFLFFSSGVF